MKSEAIRRTKTSLEAAGMDLPEPIYRVQLTEPAPLPGPAPLPRPAPHGTAPAPAPHAPAGGADTRVVADISAQIDTDPQLRHGEDLLDAAAPRE